VIPLPIQLEIPQGSMYGIGINSKPVPAPWGTVRLLDDQGIEMEAFLISTRHVEPRSLVYGVATSYYRVREIEGEDPFFIFLCKEVCDITQPIAEQELQMMEIYRFIKSQFEIINYGNKQAAEEILKYCQIKEE